jgi:hypothetical protein
VHPRFLNRLPCPCVTLISRTPPYFFQMLRSSCTSRRLNFASSPAHR